MNLKNFFKTRYRIINDKFFGYEPQFKPWWCPCFLHFNGDSNCSQEQSLRYLSIEVERRLSRLGWDRTFDGWMNVKTSEFMSMEEALRYEIEKQN